jgi:hypothetical protein
MVEDNEDSTRQRKVQRLWHVFVDKATTIIRFLFYILQKKVQMSSVPSSRTDFVRQATDKGIFRHPLDKRATRTNFHTLFTPSEHDIYAPLVCQKPNLLCANDRKNDIIVFVP